MKVVSKVVTLGFIMLNHISDDLLMTWQKLNLPVKVLFALLQKLVEWQ